MTDSISKCRELQESFQEVKLEFIRRIGNEVADHMAKKERKEAQEVNVVRYFPSPPNYIENFSHLNVRLDAIT